MDEDPSTREWRRLLAAIAHGYEDVLTETKDEE